MTNNEPEPISTEDMARFITEHRDFLINIWEWVMHYTEHDDAETVNIFSEWIWRALRQSHSMMKADNELMKKGMVH